MFLQQINTLATLYLTKWVNTGDKILDNSLIALAVCIISTFLFHFVEQWKTYYNFVIYYAYRMYNNPLATRNVPYMINYLAFETMAAFNDQTRNTYVWINPVRLNDMLRPHGISVSIDDLKKYMKQLVDTNNKSMMIDNTGHYLGYYKERIYPIAVGRYGNVIFYETSDPHLRSYGGWGSDTEHILQHIYKYLVETAVLDRSRINSDEIYVPKYVKKNSPDIELEMKSIGKINKKKTFDTLYYPQKSELMMLLSRFQNGAMYPPHIPMDNKLGILLYGPPGTGKTGTISAVANMLGRSIVVINFANITTCKQLDDILDPEKYTRHVYVFDEFDCVLDVIGRGTAPAANASKGSSMDWGSALLFADDAERKNILAEMKEGRSRKDDTPIDMAYLLQKLDGLESAEGRVIIATTNNPDKINPALLRPGRFDIKICLGPATQEMVVDILTNFFQGDEKVRTQIAAADLPGGVFSPLELINMAIQTPDCEKLLAKLLSAATAKHERAATDQNAAT